MPLQAPLEPLVALTMVPAEYAGAIILPLAAAVAAQWKAYLKGDERSRDELKKALETVHATTATSQKLIEVSTASAADDRQFREEVRRELARIGVELEKLHGKAG